MSITESPEQYVRDRTKEILAAMRESLGLEVDLKRHWSHWPPEFVTTFEQLYAEVDHLFDDAECFLEVVRSVQQSEESEDKPSADIIPFTGGQANV